MSVKKVKFNENFYTIEVVLREDFDRDRCIVEIHMWATGGPELGSFEFPLTYEFIVDNLDNERSEEFLEKLIFRMLDEHIGEIVDRKEKIRHTTIRHWMKDSKEKVNGKAE